MRGDHVRLRAAGSARRRPAQDPSPGESEGVVDVELANVTFVETQVRASQAAPRSDASSVAGDSRQRRRRSRRRGRYERDGPARDHQLNGSGGFAERTARPRSGSSRSPTAWCCATPSRS